MSKEKHPDKDAKQEDNLPAKRRVLLINVAFFALLLTGIIVIPLSGITTVIILVLVVFLASLLYAYLF